MSATEPSIHIPAIYARTSTGRPATDLVMGYILTGLLDATFKPGDRVNAKRISEELGVSIVPVREAIHFLAGEGIIELMALRGARIRILNPDEIVDWWHIFRALCDLGFEAGAKALFDKPDQAERIVRALGRMDAALDELPPAGFIMTLVDLHRVLHDIAGLTVLDEAVRRLQNVFWCSFLPDYIPFDIYKSYFAEHYRIVFEAIMRGDSATAISAFRHHVEWSSAIIKGARPTPGAAWLQGG